MHKALLTSSLTVFLIVLVLMLSIVGIKLVPLLSGSVKSGVRFVLVKL